MSKFLLNSFEVIEAIWKIGRVDFMNFCVILDEDLDDFEIDLSIC